MAFIKAVIAFEKAEAEAHKATADDATVTVAPTHSLPDVPTVAVPSEAKVVKPVKAKAPVAKPAVAKKPVAKPVPAPVAKPVAVAPKAAVKSE
jgi:hypothetical protein